VDQEVSSDIEDILHRDPIKALRGSCVWLCSIRIQSIQSLTNFMQQHLMSLCPPGVWWYCIIFMRQAFVVMKNLVSERNISF